MNKAKTNKTLDNQEKVSRILINIYGIMAIIFVLIPEWIAEIGITIENDHFKNELPKYSEKMKDTFIYISSLEIKELRKIAIKLKIHGYSNENKRSLKKRILKAIKTKKTIEFIKETLRWNNLC